MRKITKICGIIFLISLISFIISWFIPVGDWNVLMPVFPISLISMLVFGTVFYQLSTGKWEHYFKDKPRQEYATQKIRKILHATPILVFFMAWWVDVGISISYIVPYLENQNMTIFVEWLLDWPQLTDNFLIYTNTFSSFFFGCSSWSIITYYFGTAKRYDIQDRYIRTIKSIILFYPFWFGICVYLGILGPESYYNEWLSAHITLGIWVGLGSFSAIYMILKSLDLNFSDTKFTIPRTNFTKLRDFLDHYQAFFLTLIILTMGTIQTISLWNRFTISAFLSIFWTFLVILSIFLLNLLFSIKIDYHITIKQEEKESKLSEFQILLRRSKEFADKGNKNYSKKFYQLAIENWEISINYYEDALKEAPEKERIRENLSILKESLFNAYKGKANAHNKDGLRAYEKKDLQIAQKEWLLAITSYQSAIELIKDEKLNFSSEDLQKAIQNIIIRLKQLEIEVLMLETDNELKKARAFQNKDIRKAIKVVNDAILKYSEAKEKADKNELFKTLSQDLETRIIQCRDFQFKLQDKMDRLIGISPISKTIQVDEIDFLDYKAPSIIKEEKKEKLISIVREFEFIGGQIRFKVGLINETKFPFTNLKVSFSIPDALKWILHEPDYERKGDSLLISKLGVNEKKVISLYLEPINCMESPINATVSFFDVRDKPHALTMNPKMISITCPIFFTEDEANIARVKSLRRKLSHHDKKVFPLVKSEEYFSIFSSILSVLNQFDIKLIFKEFSEEDRFGEAWFYGITKVKKNQIVICILLDGRNKKLEIEVSGNEEHQITAFLAELGDRTRKQLIHNKIIDVEDGFYDIRVYILSKSCPYCYTSISEDNVQKFVDGQIIQCENCDVYLYK